jgi:hypothetical protein
LQTGGNPAKNKVKMIDEKYFAAQGQTPCAAIRLLV